MGCRHRIKKAGQVLVLLTFLGSAGSFGQIVVPNVLTNLEGNLDNTIPWDQEAPVRYQQVYRGSEVGSILELKQIRYRPDEFSGEAFSETIPDVTILLTSIAAGPDELSMVFSENLGADAVVAYTGPLHLSSRALGGSPQKMDIVITLQETLDFDPSTGLNLLMDVTIPVGPPLTAFDAILHSGNDSVSRVYCWVFEECLTTDDAMIADSVGLVTMLLPKLIMEDGFESGDTSAWSVTTP